MKSSIIFVVVAVLAVALGKNLHQREQSLDYKASHLNSRKSNVHPNLRHDDGHQQQKRINPAHGARFLEPAIRKTKKHLVSAPKKLHQSEKQRKEQGRNHRQQSLEESSSENVLPLETQLAIRSLVTQTRSLCRDVRDVMQRAVPGAKELSKKMFKTLTTKSSMRSGSRRKAMMSDIRKFLRSTTKDMKSLIPKTRALFRANNRNRLSDIFQIIKKMILDFLSKFMAGFKGIMRRTQDAIKGGGKLAYSDIYNFIKYILDIYKTAFKLPFEILNIVFSGLFGSGEHHHETTTQLNLGDGTTDYFTTESSSGNDNPSTDSSEGSSEDTGSVHVLSSQGDSVSNQDSPDEGGSSTSKESTTMQDSDSNLIFSDESGSNSSPMQWSPMPTLNPEDTNGDYVESVTLFPQPLESRHHS